MANNRELSQFASFVEVGISSIGFTTSVGIGKTNPQFNLDVAGDINFTGTFYQGGTQFIASRWSATGSDIYRLSKVGINTSIVPSALTVNGDVYVSGVVTATTFIGAVTGTATSTTNIPNLTGDISSVNTTTTLATVNSNVGTFGGTDAISVVTVNGKGLVTGISTVAPNNGTLSLGVSGTGLSGSSSFTANQSGASTFTVTSNATSANTNNTIVARDGSGNFSAGTITANLTGTATTTTNIPNLTGAITSNNTTTSLGSFTSANLATALTDETGSGSAVFATSPTLVTPVLGAASATSIVVSSGSTFTNGPVLIGSATSTGTASQPLQVTGGAYVSGFLGVGSTIKSYSSIESLEVKNGYAAFINPSVTVAPIYAYNTDTTSSTNQPYITLSDGSGNRGAIGVNYTDSALWIHGQNGIRFRGGGSSPGTTEWGRFDGSGNLGVGTASPAKKLHVQTSFVSGAARGGGFTQVLFESNQATATYWEFQANASSTNDILFSKSGTGGSSYGIVGYDHATDVLRFYTNGGEKVRIDGAGNVLVGTATSTGTASQPLQVTGGAYVSGNLGIGTTNPTAKLSIGSVSGFQDTITTVATTAVTTIDSFATATFRSTRAQVQITQSTNYQASDVLIIHDGTTASIVEYGSIATNDYLGTFSASVSGGNCLLRINMSSATSATVKVLSQRITV